MTKTYSGKYLASYDADFYRWTMAQKLASPHDLYMSDIDAMIRDRAGNIRLLEIKRLNYEPKPYQARNMALLDAILKAGIEALAGKVEIEINGRRERHNIKYHGFNLLQLSGESFFSSEFTLDGEAMNASQLSQQLNFKATTRSAEPLAFSEPSAV